MAEPSLGLFARLWLAYLVFFKVLFDGAFAGRAAALVKGPAAGRPELTAGDAGGGEADSETDEGPEVAQLTAALSEAEASLSEARAELSALKRDGAAGRRDGERQGALWMLAALQREGRLVDFLQQDIVSFPDADVGGAARVIHEGCRAALKPYLELKPVREEQEGAKVTVPAEYDAEAIKLTGAAQGAAPFSGVLRHHGWRAERLTLPELSAARDGSVIAPAEVEL